MGLISAVRSQVPVTAPPSPHSMPAMAKPNGPAQVQGVAPVSDIQHRTAVLATEPKAQPEQHLAQTKPDPLHPALGAAEAARRAYIRASIVAGVNPPPLPGR